MQKLCLILLISIALEGVSQGAAKGQSLKDSFEKQSSAKARRQEFCNMAERKAQYRKANEIYYVHSDNSVTMLKGANKAKYYGCELKGYVGRSWQTPFMGCEREGSRMVNQAYLNEWDLSNSGLKRFFKIVRKDCQTGSQWYANNGEVFTTSFQSRQSYSSKNDSVDVIIIMD